MTRYLIQSAYDGSGMAGNRVIVREGFCGIFAGPMSLKDARRMSRQLNASQVEAKNNG